MTPVSDLEVRPYHPNDRSFVRWTLRTSARRVFRLPTMAGNTAVERTVDDTVGWIDLHGSDPRWIVLVASYRGERCGLLVAPNGGSRKASDIAVPGQVARRSGGYVYVDPWYANEGVAPALDEAGGVLRSAAPA